jgi:histone deacetylase 1/2
MAYVTWDGSPDDHKSTTRYAIYLGPYLISWATNKQLDVDKSNTDAEYCSMAIIFVELYWLHMLFYELYILLSITSCLWVENIGALALSSNHVFHARIKHIEVNYHFTREKILNIDLQADYISTFDQRLNIFTNGLSSS